MNLGNGEGSVVEQDESEEKERNSFERVNSYKSRKNMKNYFDFCIPTIQRFSDYNCRFIHRWIGLIVGQQVLRAILQIVRLDRKKDI